MAVQLFLTILVCPNRRRQQKTFIGVSCLLVSHFSINTTQRGDLYPGKVGVSTGTRYSSRRQIRHLCYWLSFGMLCMPGTNLWRTCMLIYVPSFVCFNHVHWDRSLDILIRSGGEGYWEQPDRSNERGTCYPGSSITLQFFVTKVHGDRWVHSRYRKSCTGVCRGGGEEPYQENNEAGMPHAPQWDQKIRIEQKYARREIEECLSIGILTFIALSRDR